VMVVVDKNSFYVWIVKLFKEISTYLSIYLCMLVYYAYFSMNDDVMYLCLCLVNHIVGVILSVFLLFHYILSLDYTYSFRHPTFCKIIQNNSHIPLSVDFVLIQPMHIFRGGSLYKFGKQNSIMLDC
jgi:hypothetical protein